MVPERGKSGLIWTDGEGERCVGGGGGGGGCLIWKEGECLCNCDTEQLHADLVFPWKQAKAGMGAGQLVTHCIQPNPV